MTADRGTVAGAWTQAGDAHRRLLNVLSGGIEGGESRGRGSAGDGPLSALLFWEIFCFVFLFWQCWD